MVGMILVLGIVTVLLTSGLDRVVDWLAFLPGIVASLMLICVGAYGRTAKSAHRLALCAIGIGIMMGFTAFASIFILHCFHCTIR